MNPISQFLVDHITEVFFFYGLAFFTLGLALVLVSHRASAFRFAGALLPLALFGFIHGAHEWYEMFQKLAAAGGSSSPSLAVEATRLLLLVGSFVALAVFGVRLLRPQAQLGWRSYWPVGGLLVLWLVATAGAVMIYRLDTLRAVEMADVMARYSLGIPAALLGGWALMAQQRAFREQGMPQFGRDLVWAAAALLLYGAVGQLFVQPNVLPWGGTLNSANFLTWFGIPVQVFRAVMATVFMVYMLRALRAFELETVRRLEQANAAKLAAQTATLEAERRTSQQMEVLNEELRLAGHRLGLLLDISNVLNRPAAMHDRLRLALEQIVGALAFADAGLIMLSPRQGYGMPTEAAVGLPGDASQAIALSKQAREHGKAVCLHRDGAVIEFTLDEALQLRECQQYSSPTVAMALPLLTDGRAIGALVLVHRAEEPYYLSSADMTLMVGIAQQLGASVENALLHQAAQAREKLLAELLRQVVDAQESERQRIARELHDATGQGLTAVALGLRGIESLVSRGGVDSADLVRQLQELQSFSNGALRELRQIIADLRPPQLDDLGLVAAMRWYIDAYDRRRGIAVVFSAEGDEANLPAEHKTVLFRIMQETLTNTAKHAEATRVEVHLAILPAEAKLVVRDDGRGFDPAVLVPGSADPSGWGLVGIRERALLLGGRCDIETAPGAGTTVRVCVPLGQADATANGEEAE